MQLAELIRRVAPFYRAGIDPATRSFQALRIRVNDELGDTLSATQLRRTRARPHKTELDDATSGAATEGASR